MQLPDSALLVIAGFVVGTVLDKFVSHDIYMDPDLFFMYLLPPIALEAGYFMPNKLFFQNLGTILTFAVCGTLFNIVCIGLTLWAFNGYYSIQISLIDLMLFASLISAVDPVAVLSVFTEIKVNEFLYITVFGESLLNDAVTIVLYHALSSMAFIGSAHLVPADFLRASLAFFLVTIGGVLIGVLFAIIAAVCTRMSSHLNYTQPLVCLLVPYISYLVSEWAHYSGILAIVVCGVFMKPYIQKNMNDTEATVKYFLKLIASHSEAMIFIFLGLSTFSRNHAWDMPFMIVTILSCFVFRFVGIYIFSFICNFFRDEPIKLIDQFIMAYGGLRGAICYGLAMSLDKDSIPAKDIFVTTSVIVIVLTVFLQGSTIKPLVDFLQVERQSIPTPDTSGAAGAMVDGIKDDLLAGVEAIAGIRGQYFWRRRFSTIDREFVVPVLTSSKATHTDKLLNKFDSAHLKPVDSRDMLIRGLNAELSASEH